MEPKNSLLKQYQHLFSYDGVELVFTDEALQAMAEKAVAKGTGARGLRSEMELLLRHLMFRIPGDTDIQKCVVTAEAVRGTGEIECIEGASRQADTGSSEESASTAKLSSART